MEKYDIIIVGGSISGIAAANAAIENGLKPLILDRTLDMGSKMVGSQKSNGKNRRKEPRT